MSAGLPLISHSWLWENQELSDVRLVLRAPATSAKDGRSKSRKRLTDMIMHTHAAVLGSGSEFFRTKITSWRSSGTGGSCQAAASASTEAEPKRTRKSSRHTAPTTTPAPEPSAATPAGAAGAAAAAAAAGAAAGGAGHTSCEHPWCLVTLELDTPDELAAAQEAVRYLYFHDLSEEVKADCSMLLQVCRLADSYLMPACVRACASALQHLSPSQVDTHTLTQLEQHPELFRPELGFGDVIKACYQDVVDVMKDRGPVEAGAELQQRVLALFGDVVRIVKDEELCQLFMGMPYPWLSFWAASDQLSTDSENSVVLLVHMWMTGETGQLATARQQQELVKHIRMSHVSHSYLHSIIPQLGWVDAALVRRFTGIPRAVNKSEHVLSHIQEVLGVPVTWLQAAPRAEGRYEASMQWDLLADTLAENLAQVQNTGTRIFINGPNWLYHQGWCFLPSLNVVTRVNGSGCAVGYYVQAEPGCPWSGAHNIVEPCSVLASITFTCLTGSGAPSERHTFRRNPLFVGQTSGFAEVLTNAGKPGAIRLEDLAAFIVDGKFRLTMKVLEIE